MRGAIILLMATKERKSTKQSCDLIEMQTAME